MLTLIISDDHGASVVANVTRCSLDQGTGLIGYRQARPHQPGLQDPAEIGIEINDGDVIVLDAGKPIAHLCTGPSAKAFRPGGKLADEPATVPTFIGPAEPRGHESPAADPRGHEGPAVDTTAAEARWQ
jgi:hypothetical protein